MKPLQREIARFLLVLLIALTARMAFVIWWQRAHITDDQQFEFPDSQSYWELGQHIARGEPYQFGTPDLRVCSRSRVSADSGGNVSPGGQ